MTDSSSRRGECDQGEAGVCQLGGVEGLDLVGGMALELNFKEGGGLNLPQRLQHWPSRDKLGTGEGKCCHPRAESCRMSHPAGPQGVCLSSEAILGVGVLWGHRAGKTGHPLRETRCTPIMSYKAKAALTAELSSGRSGLVFGGLGFLCSGEARPVP